MRLQRQGRRGETHREIDREIDRERERERERDPPSSFPFPVGSSY